jgi:hypothetical protein
MPRIPCCPASRLANREAHVSFLAGSAGDLPGRQQTPRIRTVPVPVDTTPIRIASGPAERLDNRKAVRVAKSFSRPVTRSPNRRGSMRVRAGPAC